jgi:hypothetical protein
MYYVNDPEEEFDVRISFNENESVTLNEDIRH